MDQILSRAIRYTVAVTLLAYGPLLVIHATSVTGLGLWEIPGVELFFLVPMVALAAGTVALRTDPKIGLLVLTRPEWLGCFANCSGRRVRDCVLGEGSISPTLEAIYSLG